MVQQQLMARGIHEERVLAAMAKVPREEFVPPNSRAESYDDGPLPIGYRQTISQPYIVAFMTEQLQPKRNDRVLEVGAGSGYQAAILAELVADVYTIEIIEPLAQRAAADLKRTGCTNVVVRHGDGSQGWPEAAPFDAIIVACAPEHVPQPMVEQLIDGGRMVIPVGGFFQELKVFTREADGSVSEKAIIPVRFVPMTGEIENAKTPTE